MSPPSPPGARVGVAYCDGHRCRALRHRTVPKAPDKPADLVEILGQAVRASHGGVLVRTQCLGVCHRAPVLLLLAGSDPISRRGMLIVPSRNASTSTRWSTSSGRRTSGDPTKRDHCDRWPVESGPGMLPVALATAHADRREAECETRTAAVTMSSGGRSNGTVEVFEQAATSYDRTGVSFFGPFGAELVRRAGIRPGERVLDVGCGRGAVLFPAAQATGPTGQVTGIDLAPAMVALTAEEVTRAGLTHVDVRVGDAQQPDFPEGSFDAVLAGLVVFLLPTRGTPFGRTRGCFNRRADWRSAPSPPRTRRSSPHWTPSPGICRPTGLDRRRRPTRSPTTWRSPRRWQRPASPSPRSASTGWTAAFATWTTGWSGCGRTADGLCYGTFPPTDWTPRPPTPLARSNPPADPAAA